MGRRTTKTVTLRRPAPDFAEVTEVIQEYGSDHPYPPTVREIAERLGHPIATIHGTLVDMRASGEVEWEDHKPRTLRLTH